MRVQFPRILSLNSVVEKYDAIKLFFFPPSLFLETTRDKNWLISSEC